MRIGSRRLSVVRVRCLTCWEASFAPLWLALCVSGCLSHNQGTFDLTALQIWTAERKEADFKCTSLTVFPHPLIIFQWDKFWVLTLGPPGVESPTKEKRPHAAPVHTSIILARVALNSSLPPQLAMLFEARAAKGRGWGSWSEQAAHCVKKRLVVLLYF